MFNLEQALAKWRQEMAAAGLKTSEIIRELEEHLRDDIEQQVRSGVSESKAFQAALQHIGQPSALRNEFALAGSTGIGETLRRHKWKILLCSGARLLAAIVLHALRPPPYQSEAKLLIRYIIQDAEGFRRSPVPPFTSVSSEKRAPIMHEQVEILTSLDLARDVASRIGARKILAKAGGGEDLNRAVSLIKSGLIVEAPAGSSVLRITFRHPDSELIQPVLREVIAEFLKLHVEVRKYVERLEAAGFPTNFSVGTVTNISQIQSPSVPLFDFAASFRMLAMVFTAGMVAGFAWVFIIRWQDDHTARHLREIG